MFGRAQELCESRGGRPGLPSLNKPTVSVDVKQHSANYMLGEQGSIGRTPAFALVQVVFINHTSEKTHGDFVIV